MERRTFLTKGLSAGALFPFARATSTQVPSFELDEVSLTTLSSGIASGEYTCRSITEMYLARIEALNQELRVDDDVCVKGDRALRPQ